MHLRKKIWTWILTGVLLVLTGCGSTSEKVSEPFRYEGYSEAEYKGYTKTSQYVEMQDGTKIAVDVYLPSDGPEHTAFPTLFQFTPYGRSYVIPEGEDISLATKIGTWYYTGTGSRMWDRANSHDTVYGSSDEEILLFLSHGYAYVCADMRGCGASYGTMVDFMPEFADDGAELIAWMARQEWCDGNVGMFGGSYLGYIQLATAARQPEGLKCIIPEVAPLDGYTGEMRPGGIMLWSYSAEDMQYMLEQCAYLPDDYCYPTTPVVDEDGDGDYFDEVPLDLDSDGLFTDDYNYPEDADDEPQYADGQKREHIYYLAVKEHEENLPYSALGSQAEYIDSEFVSGNTVLSAYEVSPSAGLPAIMESGIPVYAMGGWMDAFTRGTTETYATLAKTNPVRMLVGAGYHEELSPYWKYCGEDEDKMISAVYMEKLRFFDRYLKGIENGIDEEEPILIYNMNGDGWRTESEWPLARQEETDYYFAEGNSLSIQQGEPGSDIYTVDFSTSNQYGDSETGARYLMAAPDTIPDRTEEDGKCLTYTSGKLGADMEITGYPIVDFWVSSTADTGDFYCYLEDVDKNGKAVLVTEGQLNAQFASLYDNDNMVLGGSAGVDILPDLPWHGYEESQGKKNPLADGNIVNLVFDLQPTSWVFKEGHSIRVTVCCADYPTFELTPELCLSGDAEDGANTVPDITVYRDAEHQSKITIPVIRNE